MKSTAEVDTSLSFISEDDVVTRATAQAIKRPCTALPACNDPDIGDNVCSDSPTSSSYSSSADEPPERPRQRQD